jgi:hypothetical protein
LENQDRFIIFDTEKDGGIRMSSDTVSLLDLKARLLNDTSFKEQNQHCATYFSLFNNTPLWNDEEFRNLGSKGCGAFSHPGFSR